MDQLQLETDKLNVKRRELATIFEAHPDLDMPAEAVEQVKSLNAEINDTAIEVERLTGIKKTRDENDAELKRFNEVKHPVGHGGATTPEEKGSPAEAKSIGQQFVESAAYKQSFEMGIKHFGVNMQNVDVKTLMTSSTGFTPQSIRTGQVILSAQQPPRIIDVLPAVTTDMQAVVFMQETTYTNAAAETAEGALYPEAALAYTQVTLPVQKFAVFLPVTDEQLADVQGMQDRINNRLTLMLRQKLDNEILNGNGSAPNVTGILSTTGILTNALAAGDSRADALYKGIVKCRHVGFAEPNAILMNPTDWQNLRLMRTADGIYLYGAPGEDVTPRVWGLPIVESTYVPQGTSVVADFANYTEFAWKAGMEFEVSNSHSDFFARGQLAIRAQLRGVPVVLRPSAIVSVTGL